MQCLLVALANICGATVTKFWKPNVTHVVAATDAKGACSRTFKVLKAILHGIWVLKTDCEPYHLFRFVFHLEVKMLNLHCILHTEIKRLSRNNSVSVRLQGLKPAWKLRIMWMKNLMKLV